MFKLLSIIFFVTAAILAMIVNYLRKRRMRQALGRDVNSYEMTSINTWIEVEEKEDQMSDKSVP